MVTLHVYLDSMQVTCQQVVDLASHQYEFAEGDVEAHVEDFLR